MKYTNNGLVSYVNQVYKEYGLSDTDNIFLKLIKVAPVILGRTVKDAAIELFFLVAFWLIIMQMSQGRDLIVSLFEPGGLYGVTRIIFTTLTVFSFSLSMWIIPAFLFEARERALPDDEKNESPFYKHLFFMHRVLPLVPFWLLASSLFNSYGAFFVLGALGELMLLYYFNRRFKERSQHKAAMATIGGVLIFTTLIFFWQFQVLYTEVKWLLAINLYLLAALLFLAYHAADRTLLEIHEKSDNHKGSIGNKFSFNRWLYLGCVALHVIVLLWIVCGTFNIAPESMILYIFSVYVFAIDAFVYFIQVRARRRLIAYGVAFVLVLLSVFSIWKWNVLHHTMDAIPGDAAFKTIKRDDFDTRYAALEKKIMENESAEPFPIILISGEGGGSRAGMWFSQNVINFDYQTQGAFRKHIFSVSTVSGSSVGLGAVFTFWEQTRGSDTIDKKWLDFPGAVFQNNFVGSSIKGFFLMDFFKTLFPWNVSEQDRNNILQDEEAYTTGKAMLSVMQPGVPVREVPADKQLLKRDFMSFFYEPRGDTFAYREDVPITLINTCRSNDGRRGIFSSIRLNDRFFNDAVDIAGYLYEGQVSRFDGTIVAGRREQKPITMGQACNTSELFPIISAPVYIDSLGSFVDGGYHENSGLKTTLDVYQQLHRRLDANPAMTNKYRIYILYFKNGSVEKDLYKKVESKQTAMQPLTALFNQPFAGSASYFEERAAFVSAYDSSVTFLPVALNHNFVFDSGMPSNLSTKERKVEAQILKDLITDSVIREDGKVDTVLNFPLARWLSKTIIRRINIAANTRNLNQNTQSLLQSIRVINGVGQPSQKYFQQFPQYKKLQEASDSTAAEIRGHRQVSLYENKN